MDSQKLSTTNMIPDTAKPVHSLVLDAGPILKNDPSVSSLIGQAEALYTVPAVIDEIRDEAARSRVQTTLLPFLKLRAPIPASVKVVSDFARRTGDFEVLSRPDIQILALAYELECERNHGDWRLRSVPGQKRLNGAPPSSLTDPSLQQNLGQAAPAPVTEKKPDPELRGAWGIEIPSSAQSATIENSDQTLAGAAESSAAGIESEDIISKLAIESAEEQVVAEEVPASESEPSDDEDWITPSNIKKYKAKDINGDAEQNEEQKTMQVATITTDFAMQNVLLRMNLNLLSPSLQRIKQLKTWVLRCHACFGITKDMSKQFCPRCGKPTLLRTSCSTDKDGNFKVHLKKNMQWNTRGNVYSIPKPIAGSSNGKIVSGGGKGGWGQGLILAEDQKEYVQAMTTARRQKEKDLMDEDFLPGILSGDRGRGGGKPKIGAGKNVNSRKRK